MCSCSSRLVYCSCDNFKFYISHLRHPIRQIYILKFNQTQITLTEKHIRQLYSCFTEHDRIAMSLFNLTALDYKQCNRYPLTLDFIYIHKVQHHKDTVPVGTLHQLACPDKLSQLEAGSMDKSFTWIKTLNLDPKSIQTNAMNKLHIISMTSQKNRLGLN